MCKLVERVSEIDYKNKTQSIIRVSDRGTGNEQLFLPYGVTVDPITGNIYVADYGNNCVKVFDNTAEYLLEFGDGKGEGKMSRPIGLLIRGNKVFVSHSDCTLVYQLDGKLVSRISSGGSGELQFNFPCGLSTDEYNNDIVFVEFDVTRGVKSIFTKLRLVLKVFRDNLNSIVAIITNINIIIVLIC